MICAVKSLGHIVKVALNILIDQYFCKLIPKWIKLAIHPDVNQTVLVLIVFSLLGEE